MIHVGVKSGRCWLVTLAMVAGCCLLGVNGLHAARDEDEEDIAATAADAHRYQLKSDLAYGKLDAQKLDVYAPPNAKGAPVLVYVHGGGWRKGDKTATGLRGGYLAGHGWILVSVNYRLGPDGLHPRNVQDVAGAVAWVRREIAAYGGDPEKIFLMGHSAGCHLVSLVATDGRYLKEAGQSLTAIKGVIALDTQAYNIVDLMQKRPSPLYEAAFGKDPTTHRDASPLHQVANGKGIPPFLIFYSSGTGTRPNPARKTAAEEFAAALRAADVSAAVVDASDRNHMEINRRFGDPTDEKVTVRALSFLNGIAGKRATAQSSSPVGSAIRWTSSLTFDGKADGPQPVNAMNLAAHNGMLFCGLATSYERDRYSRASSYVYVKRAADKPWELDADFGPGTSRVGMMYSARFERDVAGKPIAAGPVDLLVAFTLRTRQSGSTALQARVRDDATGKWTTVDLPVPLTEKPNVRVMHMHRDRVTGADMLFIGASPVPLGILSGTYDSSVPGRIRWSAQVETTAASRRGECKWFGMAEVNGTLFASDAHMVYRRVDGPTPQWRKVAEFPVVPDSAGASVRGLTAVPNPVSVTGWSEREMLVFGTRFALWRMRAPADPAADHSRVAEIELIPWLSERLGDKVAFVEPAFNELRPFDGRWPIGFQVVFAVEGKSVSWTDPSSFRTKPNAWFLMRDAQGRYELEEIAPRVPPDRVLFLARDFMPSPFPSEPRVVYACGFNGSYFTESLGTAWVYRGVWSDSRPEAGASPVRREK